MRLVIVDQSLVGVSGHHAEYTRCIAKEAARSATVTVLANYKCQIEASDGFDIRPTFRLPWTKPQRSRSSPAYEPTASFPAWSFLADLRRALAELRLSTDDHVFIHSIGFTEVEDVLTYLMTSDRSQAPIFDILLRRDLDEIADDLSSHQRFIAYIKAFRGLGLWPRHVRFFTDTDELTEQYSTATGIPFTTVAIPFDQQAMETALGVNRPKERHEPIIVGYLGDARPEKGYQFLPAVASKLMYSHLASRKMRLRLQSNYNLPGGETPAIPQARHALERFGAAVELLLEPLDQDEYYKQLAEMDVIVIPYVTERYARRSSGIFVQAVAAGKVVVAPRGTTMHAAAERYGMSNCVFYDEPEDLPDAVARAVDLYRELARDTTYRERWLADNSPAALVNALLRVNVDYEDAANKKAPLVLHVIDGHCAFDRTGSGALQQAQLRFLQAAGYRVATVYIVRTYPSDADLATWIDRNYEYWFESGSVFSWLVYLTQPSQERPPTLEGELEIAELLSIPETLQSLAASGEIDAVWTNYVTTAPLLDMLHLNGRVPCVLETVDVQSFQYAIQSGRDVDSDELDLELSVMERFDKLVSLSAPEGLLMAARLGNDRVASIAPPFLQEPLTVEDIAGAQNLAEVVSSAGSNLPFVDFNEVHGRGIFWQFERLSQCGGIDLLFVSSVHPPNMLSFDWFLENIYGPMLAPLGVTLLLAGSLSATDWALERQRRFPETFFLAGRVDSLRPLYAAAKIVVLPITHGAGVNIKTIDALSLGKPIVATTMALRGLAEAEKELPTFDEPDAFGKRIIDLLRDQDLRHTEAQNSWRLGAKLRDLGYYFARLNEVFSSLLGDRALSAEAPERARSWEFIEWNNQFDVLNKFARALIERLPHLPVLCESFERELLEPDTRNVFARIVQAVACTQSAPILESQSYLRSYLPAKGKTADECVSDLDVIRNIYVRAMLPYSRTKTGLRLLAGCGSIADVFRASGARATGAMLEAPAEIDITILAQGLGGRAYRVFSESFMDFYENCYVPHLSDKGVRVAVVGDLGIDVSLPGVYYLPHVDDPAPILSATRLVVAPWSDLAVMHPAAMASTLRTLIAGKPLVASASAMWFLETPEQRDFAVTTHERFAERIKELLEKPELRLAAAAKARELANRVFEDVPEWQDIAESERAVEPPGAMDIRFAEWGQWIRWSNDLLTKIIAKEPLPTGDVRTLGDELSDPAMRYAWEELIDAICGKRDAPILRCEQQYADSAARRIKNISDFAFEFKKLAFETARSKRTRKTGSLRNGMAAQSNGHTSALPEREAMEARVEPLAGIPGSDGAYYAPVPPHDPHLASPPRSRGKVPPVGSVGPDPRAILLDSEDSVVEMNLSGRMCGEGWYAPEFTPTGCHRWTGPQPMFNFEIFLADEAYQCEMRMFPAQRKNVENFAVHIDGERKPHGAMPLDDGTVLVTFDIPSKDESAQSTLAVIGFQHGAVCSPADWGEEDNRILGLSVRSITFTRRVAAAGKRG